jgi:hypothetical protein
MHALVVATCTDLSTELMGELKICIKFKAQILLYIEVARQTQEEKLLMMRYNADGIIIAAMSI